MIAQRAWQRYVSRMSAIDKAATDSVARYIDDNGLDDVDTLIGYAYGASTKYGEAAAALAAEMYDAIAELENAHVPPAIPAETATYGEVADAVRGVLDKSQNTEMISASVGRLAKRAGADTTLQNAARDGAQYAWVPNGDTCAFCIMLASNGWTHASTKALKGGHATHIHSNCDCQYCVKFTEDGGPPGYDSDVYLKMYEDAPLHHWNTPDGKPPPGHENAEKPTWQNRVKALRREAYTINSEEIKASARSAYAKRRELERSKAEEIDV